MSQLSDEIVARINIVDYISRYVSLRKSGVNYSGLCPFHNEKTPSFVVSDEKQIFKCFGCGKGGNIIQFAMEYDRLDYGDVIRELANQAHIDITQYQWKQNSEDKDSKEKLKQINKLANEFFRTQLYQHPSALEYLYQKRKLQEQDISMRKLGYAPDGYTGLVNFLRSKDVSYDDMLDSGLIRKSPNGDYYDFFRNRIIFPIYDHISHIVGFTSRVINPEDSPKYLNTPDTAIYNKSNILYGLDIAKQSIKQHKKLIVVEGNMDVIALSRMNMSIGVATCGTSLTESHIKTLHRWTEHIYIVFDNDVAGQEATIRAAKLFLDQQVYPRVIILPKKYKDMDDLANDDIAPGEKEEILNHSQDIVEYIIYTLCTHYDIRNPVDIKTLSQKIFEIWIHISDLSIIDHYIAILSQVIGSSHHAIMTNFKNWYKKNKNIYTHQNIKENNNNNSYYYDPLDLLVAIITNNYRHRYTQDPRIDNLINIYNNLSDYINNSVDMEQIPILQLRRDQQLQSINLEKSTNIIHKYLSQQLHNQIKLLLKTNLSENQKIKIMGYIKELR